jgi:hypothetical protein
VAVFLLSGGAAELPGGVSAYVTGSFYRHVVDISMDYYERLLVKAAVIKLGYLGDRGGSSPEPEDRTRLELRQVTWLSLPPVGRRQKE